ncbi:putative DsbA family dithiol-disulfide isomerase [Xanthomonas arboricola]|nr:putative DsbA family dithiol-disulfide isomerase [Xanthomonas cannabis]
MPNPTSLLMRIDIWSDVVCPWCWIGKRRFEQAVAALGARAPVLDIHYHAFELDPDAGAEPVPLRDALARKFGGVERVEQMLAQTQATARAEGLPFDFGRGQVQVSTLRAHRLLWLATHEGDVGAVMEALFHAHFAEGRNVAATETLLHAGEAGGLAASRVQAMLDSDEGTVEVQAQLAQARALGIRAVPSFVIDGRSLIQGAQPAESFAQALLQLAAESVPVGGPDACGPDGCPV